MGIDGIGNKPPTPPAGAPASGAAGSPAEVHPFEVARPTSPAEVVGADATPSRIDRVRAGEMGLDAYIDAKAREATGHLAGLSPARLDEVRAALRERLATDPAFVDLVRAAAGRAPSPRDD